MSVRVLANKPPVQDSATVMRSPACLSRRTRRAASVWISTSIGRPLLMLRGQRLAVALDFLIPEASRAVWACGLAAMTPPLHGVDRGFESHRAHFVATPIQREMPAFGRVRCAQFTRARSSIGPLVTRDHLRDARRFLNPGGFDDVVHHEQDGQHGVGCRLLVRVPRHVRQWRPGRHRVLQTSSGDAVGPMLRLG